MENSNVTVASKTMNTTTTKMAPTNSNLIGKKLISEGAVKFQYRKASDFIVEAYGFEILDTNSSGNKLKVKFLDKDGNAVSWLDPHQGRMESRMINIDYVKSMAAILKQELV